MSIDVNNKEAVENYKADIASNATAFDTEKKAVTDQKVDIRQNPNPNPELGTPQDLCLSQLITLTPGSGYASYEWPDGSKEEQLAVTSPGTYWVEVTDNNDCRGSDTVVIRPCDLVLWMPEAFTPNGDGLNDVFQAEYDRSLGLKIDFHLLIFNKWGEEIFRSDDIDIGWDGTYKGKPCQPDMYTWTIKFSAPANYSFHQKSPQQGTVMLLK